MSLNLFDIVICVSPNDSKIAKLNVEYSKKIYLIIEI